MLSTENPPPDPSSETSQIKSNFRTDDEKAISDNNLDAVDLLESGLDDTTPLPPKFSIRDYVFSTRGKDIKTNWPFSLENLQICLKHGVKDVLPPFQSVDSVRNLSVSKSGVENTRNSDDLKLSGLDNNVWQELAVEEEDKEIPSTSIPPINSPFFEPEAEKFAVPATNKVQGSIQNQTPVKKCKLIVKLSNISEPKPNEDSGLNSSLVSETMASKVCPVCKTFSSSSNTTLNAHIDQCLSGGSTPVKWTTTNSNVIIKHRIKPRKTRLMVDIYATALHGTLEDLDRRNGTNWASNTSFPAHQDPEACAEEKSRLQHSSCGIEENEESAVYIDSNGTKVRILSKFSDLPSSSNGARDDSGPQKVVKRDKGNKFLSSKKKKYLVQRHEFLKGPENCSSNPRHCSQVLDGQEKPFPPDGYNNEHQAQALKAHDRLKSDDLGMIKKWVGSKRTGLKKKFNIDPENQHPEKTVENLRTRSNMSSESDTSIRGVSDTNSPISAEHSPFPTESRKRKEKLPHDERMEHTGKKTRVGVSLLASQEFHGKKNGFNVIKSRKGGPSFHDCFVDPPNVAENHASSKSIKKMGLNTAGSLIGPKMSEPREFSSGVKVAFPPKRSFDHAIPSGDKKFSSLRKNLLSVRHQSVREPKKKMGRKNVDFKKPVLWETSESDKEPAMLQCSTNRQGTLVESPFEISARVEKDSINRSRFLRVRKKRGGLVKKTSKEGNMASKGAERSLECISRGVRMEMDSFSGHAAVGTFKVIGGVKEGENVQDAFSCEPLISKAVDGEAFVAFGKSLDSIPSFAGASDVECISGHYRETYKGHSPADLILGGEGEMYSSEEAVKDFVIPEMDSDEGQGNYFIDVDPIPIPGPPGSFLPSPGRLCSEELQGNSSLTTCNKVHSSDDDEHEQVDKMDSSNSPISAESSMVSNSVPVRPDSVSFANLSVHSRVVQGEKDRIDPVVESSTPFESADERTFNLNESRANLMLNEKSNPRYGTGQSCCCARKEGALQDSQLLGRRALTSLPLLVKEKQTSGENINKLPVFNSRSETLVGEPTSGYEKNTIDSVMGYAPTPVSQNSEAKFDFESPTITSNPVLRLMGKNLMVVKKDENMSPQTRVLHTPSCMVNDHPGQQQPCVDRGTVPCNNIQNENLSFHQTLSRGKNGMTAQPLDFTPSNGLQIPHTLRNRLLAQDDFTLGVDLPQCTTPYPSALSFNSSLEYGGGFSSNPDHLLSSIRLDPPTTCDIKKVRTPVPQLRPSDCSSSKPREVIVIDDSPESEVVMEAGGSSGGGISANVAAFGYDPMQVNSFYSYQTRNYPIPNGPRMTQNGNNNTQMPPYSLTASTSPSTGHLMRSSMYFSPGFPRPASFT